MKLTNKQIVEGAPFLNALGSVNLPPEIGFRISRLIRKVREIGQDFEAERIKLVNLHGEKDDDGNLKTFEVNGQESTKIADMPAYTKGVDALLAAESEIDVQPIPVKDLGNVPLAPNLFAALDWLIVE